MTTALITGVSGQDGSYLAQHLTGRGDKVWGLLRGQAESHPKYRWLKNLMPSLGLVGGDMADDVSLREAIEHVTPDVIYNLAAVSSPTQAWSQPGLTANVTGMGLLKLLNAVRDIRSTIRVVHAGSLVSHGPYGAAKTYSKLIADDYRTRGSQVMTALFGGHHSPRKARVYFSRKVTSAAVEIANGQREALHLGSLARLQDWGWADDFILALTELAESPPGNYVISTGEPHTCQEWVEIAFATCGLDWQEYVQIDPAVGNVTDIPVLTATPDPRLSWSPRQDFNGLIKWMINEEDVAS